MKRKNYVRINDDPTETVLQQRLAVLHKVKKLFSMIDTEYMSTSQLAVFFGVSERTITINYELHKEAFILDGVFNVQNADYILAEAIAHETGEKILNADLLPDQDSAVYDFRQFPKRAIFRLAMLMTDNPVAAAVRDQLLNLTECVEFQCTTAARKDIKVTNDLIVAMNGGNENDTQKALKNYRKRRNRYLFIIEPFFPRENALADMYAAFGELVNNVKWSVAGLMTPSDDHPKGLSYRKALKQTALNLAKKYYKRNKLTQEELDIVEKK
ncbi:MAG: hypothetical protein NC299_17430 [Lachnospiraceae bacterium]|nr:hypothetical protein [Ruminococcus sp.]MCM1277114.1 hypothetical protein [Lachnospiraceae bacterium]